MYRFRNERLRTVRELEGVSQEEAAKRIGTTGQHWGKLERGEVDPSVSTLVKIFNAFARLSPLFLFVNDAEKKQQDAA